MTNNSHNSSSSKVPTLSLITVNYNGIKDTIELLDSIYRTIKSIIFEVIVVDNFSSDRSEIITIKEKFPDCVTIASKSNLGFAGGNNLGIDISKGEYIMLINNDTLISEDHFDILLSLFDNNPKIGAISPKILFANPTRTIQFAGYTPLSPITLRNNLIGFLEPDDGRYSEAKQTPYCHGAAMIVSRKAIERVGKMSEVYFLYYEELDWSTAISRGGYELWYDPCQFVVHKESSTIGDSSPTKTYYLSRNRLLYAYRNLLGSKKFFSIIYQLFISIPKGVFVYLLKGNKANAIATIKGAIDFFSMKNKNL